MRRSLSTYIPLALTAATAVTAATLIAGCGRKSAQAAQAADTQPQQLVVGTENVAIAHHGSVTNGPTISGSLDAALDATIRAQVAGSVVSTTADIGQVVTRGQTLGRIDASALQDAFLSARSGVASAQASYDVAARNLARSRTLLQAGAIAQRDLESSSTQESGARAALADARSRLATASKNFENTRITAPFRGIVSVKSVSPGDVVQPGAALFTVVDPSTMRLEASVPSDQLSLVRVGTDVVFTVTGYPGREFHGTVSRISPAADPTTRQVQIIVSVPNPGHSLVAGLYADGRLSSSTRNGIVVPASAIDLRMQRPAVVRVRGGKVEHVDVTLGMRDPTAETVEIASGVNVGDTLLVAAAQGITPGTPVRVQAPPTDRGVGTAGTPLPAGQSGNSSTNSSTSNNTGNNTSTGTTVPSGGKH